MKDPILITGCARSGTSMIAGVINMCGAFGGDMSGPNHNNRKGMFENAKIRQDVVKPYFKQIKVDPMGQYPLPDVDNMLIPREWKGKIRQVLIDEGYEEGPWMYKGAKMCLHWPVWHYAFPNAKWIIVRRRTGDIIQSCMKTGFMTAFGNSTNQKMVQVKDEQDGWKWWVHQHEARFVEMMNEGLNCKIVWPDRMVRGDYQQLYETIDWLGLEWKSSVLDFIDPLLWHSRKQEKQPNHGIFNNR